MTINTIEMSEEFLNEKDCSVLRSALLRKIYPSLTISLFLFLIVFLLSMFAISYGSLFIILTLLSVLAGIVAFFLLTSKIRKDLSTRKTTYEKGIITNKTHKADYEAGSVTMPVTIFSFLTPKIFKREMKLINTYSVLINDIEYEVMKEDFSKAEKGEEIYIKKALYSNIFLGLEKKNEIEE